MASKLKEWLSDFYQKPAYFTVKEYRESGLKRMHKLMKPLTPIGFDMQGNPVYPTWSTPSTQAWQKDWLRKRFLTDVLFTLKKNKVEPVQFQQGKWFCNPGYGTQGDFLFTRILDLQVWIDKSMPPRKLALKLPTLNEYKAKENSGIVSYDSATSTFGFPVDFIVHAEKTLVANMSAELWHWLTEALREGGQDIGNIGMLAIPEGHSTADIPATVNFSTTNAYSIPKPNDNWSEAEALELASHIKDAMRKTKCPADGCNGKKDTLFVIIQHVNDSHKWTREKIADWLDELAVKGWDLEIMPDPVVDPKKLTEQTKCKCGACQAGVYDEPQGIAPLEHMGKMLGGLVEKEKLNQISATLYAMADAIDKFHITSIGANSESSGIAIEASHKIPGKFGGSDAAITIDGEHIYFSMDVNP